MIHDLHDDNQTTSTHVDNGRGRPGGRNKTLWFNRLCPVSVLRFQIVSDLVEDENNDLSKEDDYLCTYIYVCQKVTEM